jgi:hypothetical protein
VRRRFVDCVLYEAEIPALNALLLEAARNDEDELALVERHGLRATKGGSPNGLTHLGSDAGRTIGPQTVSVPKITHALHFLSTTSSTGVDDQSKLGREQHVIVEWKCPPKTRSPCVDRRTYQQGNVAQVEIVEY